MRTIRTLWLAATVAALTLTAAAQSWLTNGLVAYYPLNGSAIDASGLEHHGTISAITLATDRYGQSGQALAFGGHQSPPIPAANTSLVTLPAGSLGLAGSTEATVSLWCYANQTNAAAQWLFQTCPYVFYVPPPSPWGFGFCITAGGQLNAMTASDSDRNFSTTAISPHAWYHVVAVYSGSASDPADKVRIYLNGVRDTIVQVRPEVIPDRIPATADSAFLGASHFKATGDFVHFLDGAMDDVRAFCFIRASCVR